MAYRTRAGQQGTTNTTGVGQILVNETSLLSGYLVSEEFDYYIVDPATGDYESGRGQVQSATTFDRLMVRRSNYANNFVSFASGIKFVEIRDLHDEFFEFTPKYAEFHGNNHISHLKPVAYEVTAATIQNGHLALVTTPTSNMTLTLPKGVEGHRVGILIAEKEAGNLTISPNGSDNLRSASQSVQLDALHEYVELEYTDEAYGWAIISSVGGFSLV